MVILFGQFIVSIDLTVLNIALPDLTKDLNPTSDQLLWIVDVYSLVLAGCWWRRARFRPFRQEAHGCSPASFCSAVGSLLVLFANSPEFVIAIRAF